MTASPTPINKSETLPVFVSLVRQTETQLLESGQPVAPLAQAAQACTQSAAHPTEDQ